MIKKISWSLVLFLMVNICYAELKIGFVNVIKVIEKAPQAEKAKKNLEKEFLPRKKHLISQVKEIKKLEEKFNRDASIMGESERRKLERDIISKKREAEVSRQEFNEDLNIRRNEELNKLRKRIKEAINVLAKDKKFDLLLTDGVVYSSKRVDVTSQVQKRLISSTD